MWSKQSYQIYSPVAQGCSHAQQQMDSIWQSRQQQHAAQQAMSEACRLADYVCVYC